METQLDYFDTWTETQKTLMKNLVTAQKEMRSQWLESMEKVQSSVNSLPGVQDNAQAKEALKAYNTWFDNMLEATRTMSDEAFKVQEAMHTAIEKQLELGREVVGSLSEVSKPSKKK